jgi:hypothetical protein
MEQSFKIPVFYFLRGEIQKKDPDAIPIVYSCFCKGNETIWNRAVPVEDMMR